MAKALPHRMTRLTQKLQFSLNGVIIAVPFYWLLIFFLAPFVIVFKISVAESLIASPPFSPFLNRSERRAIGTPCFEITLICGKTRSTSRRMSTQSEFQQSRPPLFAIWLSHCLCNVR
ncbi:MAG: hypothetical protein CM1200mP41_13830 [Gammaproteobacteria bacterium]|nr:MAG: hypothetical protein CM1200mP41_13830 [Gammaproteobacteria bacterium]